MAEKKKAPTWIVKAYRGYKLGWQPVAVFHNTADADDWIRSQVRRYGYSPYDFNVVRR